MNREDPSLEEDKQRLVTSVASDKKKLAELEDTILSLLRSATGIDFEEGWCGTLKWVVW